MNDEPSWTVEDCAGYLAASKDSVRSLVAAKQIPFFKMRSRTRFRPELVAEWVAKGGTSPSGDEPGAGHSSPAGPRRDAQHASRPADRPKRGVDAPASGERERVSGSTADWRHKLPSAGGH